MRIQSPEHRRALRKGLGILGAALLTITISNEKQNHSPPDKTPMHALSVGHPALVELHAIQEAPPPTAVSPIETTTTTVTLPPPSTTETQPLPTEDTTPPDTVPPDSPPTENVGGSMRDMGSFYATCYELRGRTASGTYVHDGTIAVDPNLIPLGSSLYIDGWGNGTAEDTGGAIKGHHIDIWRSSCAGWGNPNFEVFIVEG